MSVSGGSVTISSLMSSTTYSIQVSAVNSVGTGVYSDLLIVQTESKCNPQQFVYYYTYNIINQQWNNHPTNFLLQVYTSVSMMTSSLTMAMC